MERMESDLYNSVRQAAEVHRQVSGLLIMFIQTEVHSRSPLL
jgi:hypothetical protein